MLLILDAPGPLMTRNAASTFYLQEQWFSNLSAAKVFRPKQIGLTFEIRGAEAQPRGVKSAAFNRPCLIEGLGRYGFEVVDSVFVIEPSGFIV